MYNVGLDVWDELTGFRCTTEVCAVSVKVLDGGHMIRCISFPTTITTVYILCTTV